MMMRSLLENAVGSSRSHHPRAHYLRLQAVGSGIAYHLFSTLLAMNIWIDKTRFNAQG